MDKQKRIKILLEMREKMQKRLKELEKEFEQEKDNQDAWPGHDTNFLLQFQQDEEFTLLMLKEIEKELKELGVVF